MIDTWITPEWSALLMVVLSALGIYAGLLVLTRLAGLRSFSKMSSFDFAITVALGSLLASTIVLDSVPLGRGLVALAALYAIQIAVAMLRSRYGWVSRAVDNAPLLLMDGATVLHDNLRHAKMTEEDLRAKLREANVLDLRQVRAVIFETTGDVSVLHGDADGLKLDAQLLRDVRRTQDHFDVPEEE